MAKQLNPLRACEQILDVWRGMLCFFCSSLPFFHSITIHHPLLLYQRCYVDHLIKMWLLSILPPFATYPPSIPNAVATLGFLRRRKKQHCYYYQIVVRCCGYRLQMSLRFNRFLNLMTPWRKDYATYVYTRDNL